MDIKRLKKPALITGYIILGLYILFLLIPFAISPLVNSYSHYLSKVIEDLSGFKVKFENVKMVTTPKLTTGVKASHISIMTPDNDEFLSTDNAQVKISLIPLLIKRIELDTAGADNIAITLKIKKDGKFILEDYILKQSSEEDLTQNSPQSFGLPFGFKLSNHMPNIKINNYKTAFIDINNKKEYSIQGTKLNISDFILNKKIKAETKGKITLEGNDQFNYDIKIFNKLMPDLDLNELIFNPKNQSAQQENQYELVNILDIFQTIHKNQFCANIKTDLKTSGEIANPHFEGLINIEGITILVDNEKLPDSNFMLDFKGKQIILNSELYTALNEKTTIIGDFKTGKNTHFNLAFKSNTKINNIFKIINSIAKSFNYKYLETLSATGEINADFNIKSNKKDIESSGYFKIPSAKIKYALYNILIDNIKANIDLTDNGIKIKDTGFTILSQPLKLSGTINHDTTTDINLTADKLLLKGLITAAGQIGLLKDNNIKNGTLSANASLIGNFQSLKPSLDLSLDNLDIFNKPSESTIKLKTAKVNVNTENTSYKGTIDINSIEFINPLAIITVPLSKITIDPENIEINNTYMLFNNSKIDILGEIKDYAGKKPSIDIKAKGAILASDIKSIIPTELGLDVQAKGKLPLIVNISGNNNTQNIDFQLLANPTNYVSIINIDKLCNNSTLINSGIKISNDNIKLSDTGIYVVSGTKTLSDNIKNNISGATNIISVKGAINNLSSKPQLDNINVKTSEMLTASIPGFKDSKVNTQFDITLNGQPANPKMKGFANIPSLSLPSIKTNIKNMAVDITNQAITIDTPTINIDNSIMDAKTIVSTNFSKGIIINSIDYNALIIDSDTLIKAMEGLPVTQASVSSTSAKSNSSTIKSNANADIGIKINKGNGSVSKFKSGNIVATDLNGEFSLNNNIFYLNNLQGSAYNGKFNGNISVNLINGKTNIDFQGNGMNAENAIYSTAGLKNALSGTLSFNAENLTLNSYSKTQNDMMKSITGNIDFKITDGKFANIGRFENLLFAQNIISNGIMGALVSPIANMPVMKSASEFKSITGEMTLKNGWAQIKSIKTTGPSMAYYITGNYNLINTSANLTILGRLGADIVAALGPIGELSVSKLTSYIPKFGTLTGNIINSMTTDPKSENIAEIPQLSNGSKNYKDFKAVFNGGIESKSSVKSFKWLSVCDTSQIEGGTLKDQLEASKQNMQQLRKEQIEEVKQSVEEVKNSAKQTAEELKNQLQNTKDSLNELKNLFKKPETDNTSGN